MYPFKHQMLIISIWTYKNRNLKPISLHNTIIVLCKEIGFVVVFFLFEWLLQVYVKGKNTIQLSGTVYDHLFQF